MTNYYRGQPLEIGTTTQFLFRDSIVEDRWRLKQVTSHPIRHLGNPVLVADKPWEETVYAPQVLFDAAIGRHRMYYNVFSLSNYFSGRGPRYFKGYAESEDGFTWTKILRREWSFGGFEKTNVPYPHTADLSGANAVFLDEAEKDPAKRYKAICGVKGKLGLITSADGYAWDQANVTEIIGMHLDCFNQVIRAPQENRWYLLTRPPITAAGTNELPEGHRHTRRRVAVSTSEDLLHWSEPRTVLYPDEIDPPDYNWFTALNRHGTFIGFNAVMYHDPPHRSEQDVHLAWSDDGFAWHRTWDRKPFLPRGGPGTWDGNYILPPTEPLLVGDQMIFYYSGNPHGENVWNAESAIGFCRLRTDRFIGQTADDTTGYLLTRQFVLPARKLRINCSAVPAPYSVQDIRVEIIDRPAFAAPMHRDPAPAAGRSFDDCDPVKGDFIDKVLTWRGNADLANLVGKPVRLRFRLRNAAIFTFRFADE